MARPALIVSGLGRCGTTLVMDMLAAGGIPTVGAAPDYEVDEAAATRLDTDWLMSASGKAVKILDPHRHEWPAVRCPLVVIYLARDKAEQASSQIKFLRWNGGNVGGDRRARRALQASLLGEQASGARKLRALAPLKLIPLRFEDVIQRPMSTARGLAGDLLDIFPFNPEAAAAVVIPRPTACAPDMSIEESAIIRSMEIAPCK